MKITLLADYRGVLTNEVFYPAGEHDLPDGVAQALIKAGRAIESFDGWPELKIKEPATKPKTTRTKRTRKPKAK